MRRRVGPSKPAWPRAPRVYGAFAGPGATCLGTLVGLEECHGAHGRPLCRVRPTHGLHCPEGVVAGRRRTHGIPDGSRKTRTRTHPGTSTVWAIRTEHLRGF